MKTNSESKVSEKNHRRFFPPSIQGIVTDQGVTLANLSFTGFIQNFFTRLYEQSPDNTKSAFTMGIIFLGVVFLRLAGLYLKRLPFQARLGKSNTKQEDKVDYLQAGILTLFCNFPLTLLNLVLLFLPFIIIEKEIPTFVAFYFFFCIALIGIEFVLFVRTMFKPLNETEQKLREENHWRFFSHTEMLADFCLWVYMMAWQGFYFYFITPPNGKIDSVWFLLNPMFLVVFALFYLMPRNVFLREDYKYPATWISIVLVYISTMVGLWTKG